MLEYDFSYFSENGLNDDDEVDIWIDGEDKDLLGIYGTVWLW
jgi:hypothetical protein